MQEKYEIIIKPVKRHEAKEFCLQHGHAPSLPNSSKYYLVAYINGKLIGLAVWGWGITPKATIKKLFGLEDTKLYLELNRFYLVPDTPKYAESKFLSLTQKILFQHLPKLKFLFTYAAGFQGMIGIIYKACSYDYIGKQITRAYHNIPGVGMVHDIAIYHRYGAKCHAKFKKNFPQAVRIFGYNFSYIKFRDDKTKKEMMEYANFEILPYPSVDELKIWDEKGKNYSLEEVKQLKAISLKSKRL